MIKNEKKWLGTYGYDNSQHNVTGSMREWLYCGLRFERIVLAAGHPRAVALRPSAMN